MKPDLPESVDAVAAIHPVSRETAERLEIYAALLRKWQKSQNLVSPSTLPQLWTRHMADSAQALAAVPSARRWVDIGSGAGFPGLVTAILLADEDGARVDLVESNQGKVAFLRTVARETGAPAFVHAERIESFVERFDRPVDAVSARALASLSALCRLTAPLAARGVALVFHKGQDFEAELAETTQSWDVDLVKQRSRIDPGGSMVVIRRLVSRSPG